MKAHLLWVLLVLTSPLCAQTEPPAHPLVSTDTLRLPATGNLVSKDELLVPPKAILEFQRSQRAYRSGDVRGSTRHLEKALRIYPNYLEGHNDLGAQYLELKEYEKGVAEFQKAIQIDPHVVQPFNNLGVAFFLTQRYAEAEEAARRALEIEPHHAMSRYVLGCTLEAENRNPEEALELLRASKSEFSDARLLMAKILVRRGDVEGAKKELQEYLTVPGIEKRDIVERWLARLSGAGAQ
jgi:tetratricopeptide (TPR) repeat protein